MADYDFDFFVIGAGSGGVRAARIAAGHRARVAIAEEWRIGGTCVLRGCVPKKLLVYASRFADDFEDAVGYGWTMEAPTFSWPALVAAKDREIQRLSEIYERNLLAAGVAIYKSRATVQGPHTIALEDGRKFTAGTVLVATGAWPVVPDIPGARFALTSNGVFDLPELPESLAIVGGGYIAVEFAALLQRLGTKVTLVHRGPKILRGFDEDIRDAAADALRAAGVRLLLETQIIEIRKKDGLVVTFHDQGLANFHAVMFASGRMPNAQGLGLEAQGVLFDPLGAIRVDSFSQTTVPWIYAVGDVTNRLNLTPVAIREGQAVADTLFGGRPTTTDHRNVPTAVFMTPEIGVVGLTEMEARARHAEIDIYKTSFRPLKATVSGRAERVLMKMVVEPKSDRVLGVHIMGADAGEMIQLAGVAVKLGATKEDFDATVAVHPTAAEELVTMRTPYVARPPVLAEPPARRHPEPPIAMPEPAAEVPPDMVAERTEPAIQAEVLEGTLEAVERMLASEVVSSEPDAALVEVLGAEEAAGEAGTPAATVPEAEPAGGAVEPVEAPPEATVTPMDIIERILAGEDVAGKPKE